MAVVKTRGAAKTKAAKEVEKVELPEVPADQEEAIALAKTYIDKGSKGFLMCMWHAGRILSISQEGKVISDFVEAAADALGRKNRIVYDVINFYDKYPDFANVEKLGVNWSSAKMLASVPDDKDRKTLEKKAVDKKMSSREVEIMVREHKSKNVKGKKAPKSKGPSPVAYFNKVEATLEKMKDELQAMMLKRTDMYPILLDEERTKDAVYEKACKCLDRIAAKSRGLCHFLETNVEPIPDELEKSDEKDD